MTGAGTPGPFRPLAGVDGCRAGFVAVARLSEADWRVQVVPDMAALLALLPDDTLVAVDMPIGLPDRVGAGGRGPEAALRPHLGARKSSVFSIPSRAAVESLDYREACARALASSEPPRRISQQGFNLFPKIREIDGLLRSRPELIERIHEVHPEGTFMAMNGFRPLLEPKKQKGRIHASGMEERRRLLTQEGFPPSVLAASAQRGVGADDLLDACAALWTAARIVAGTARLFPDVPAHDRYGIPVVIKA